MISCLGGVQGLVQGLHLLTSQTNICDIWHGCKFITWLKKYTSHPSHPFPAVHNDACVQVTFWQAGHKGMYDILITVYELSPGNQVSSSIYSFAILCFCYDPVQGLLYAYVHYICRSKQIFAVTEICSLLVCYILWAANPFQQDTMGVGIPNKILHWNVSWWLYYNIE